MLDQLQFGIDGVIRKEEASVHRKQEDGVYYSAVYTERPPYADFDPPHKFAAIQAIVGKRMIEHPNAICSYSGGRTAIF